MLTSVRRSMIRVATAAGLAIASLASAHGQGLIRDTETERAMREYTDPLLVAAGLDVSAVDFYLVGDMEFNAFVAGGQNIFLNTGTIIRADTPNEIKGVIAHEIGHIEGAHIIRRGEASRAGLATMAASLGVGLIAAGHRFFELIELLVHLLPDPLHRVPLEARCCRFAGDHHGPSQGP